MELNERYKGFPIKFYKTDKGVYYENSFINGNAKDLNDAFNQIKNKNLDKDLFYFYDDVQEIKVGAFEPALKDRKTKQGIYLGKLNLELDLNNIQGEHTVKYLSKNPDKIKDHEKFINVLKSAEKRTKFLNDLKAGIKKVAGYFKGLFEYFSPIKTRYDLICEHCGDIIPTRCYYEEWHKKNYHIECLWDKLVNGTKSNEHENTIEYFLSLQKLLPDWPGDLESQDTYESDLELFKINKRLGLVESINEAAAMKQSNEINFKDFYDYVIKNPKQAQKTYFSLFQDTIRIPSDTILHDWNKHKLTCEQWEDCLSHINNIQNADKSTDLLLGKPAYLFRISAREQFGVAVADCPKYFYIMTCFTGHANSIDNWIKNGSPRRLASQLPASDTLKGSSVTLGANGEPNNIITYIKSKIKT